MFPAPVGSPNSAELPFKVASSNYLQFSWVPPAKWPKVAFSNYLQFPWAPPAKLPTKFQLNYLKITFQITFDVP